MTLNDRAILIVEDEVVLAMMLEDYLTDAGARVIGPAMTVKRAMELLQDNVVDVAILDVNLRGERTVAVGVALREKNIPYIYATGYGGVDEVVTLDAPTVRKPYRLAELEAALINVLEQAGSDESNAGRPE